MKFREERVGSGEKGMKATEGRQKLRGGDKGERMENEARKCQREGTHMGHQICCPIML